MSRIRCLCLDVDGVLTDGRVYVGADGRPARAFHIHDGLATHRFQRLGGVVVIITGKRSEAVAHRARELNITHLIQDSENKLADLQLLLPKLEIGLDEVAAIGDDLLDLPVLMRCGYPIAVANAVAEVKAVARFVTQRSGGQGAVREAVEHLLHETGQWREIVDHYRRLADQTQ
ncbi:MAG: HAD-IIIA family hydrolase [Planctomycetes bacterium]|nr:HAD-IIIA family hydrolase [Planctomycetota bacterium]